VLFDSYILTSSNGFFPTDLLMTVQSRRYIDGLKLGSNIGYDLGTMSLGVVELQKAIKILKRNNFKINNNTTCLQSTTKKRNYGKPSGLSK
jgi:hypothetical protein